MTINIPPKDTVGEQRIMEGLYFEWLDEGKLYFLRLTNMAVETVDAYIDIQKQLITEWDVTQPYLLLHDISHPSVDVNAQIRKRAPELWQVVRQRKIFGLTVFMLNDKGLNKAAKVFINTMQRILVSDLKFQFVNDRERGLVLMRDYLKQHSPKGD
jgi:hypothetical protein